VNTNTWISFLAITLAFGICGQTSSYLYDDNKDPVFQLVALPFALLCAVFINRSVLGILVIPGICLSWFAARQAVLFSLGLMEHSLDSSASSTVFDPFAIALAAGGVTGATGIYLCMSIARRYFSLQQLAIVCSVSGAASLPFLFWIHHQGDSGNSPQAIRLAWAFAIWQAAVGGCLFLMSLKPRKSTS
jgi:hypothetical protein